MLTQSQETNLRNLIAVIQRKIELNHPKGCLNSYLQPCGSYGCVLGDYVLAHYMQGRTITAEDIAKHENRGVDPDLDTVDDFYNHLYEIKDDEQGHFGCSLHFDLGRECNVLPDWGYVFGLSFSGTLEERLDYLQSVLNKHLEETQNEN